MLSRNFGTFRAQNIIFIASPEGNERKDEHCQNEKDVFHGEEDFAVLSSCKSGREFMLAAKA